ncbi:MAG: protein-L-isoaspartate(D-aspartate) O-methyltransferase [archaeon]
MLSRITKRVDKQPYVDARKQGLINNWKSSYDFSDRVIKAFSDVERADFIPGCCAGDPYEDYPLPIPAGQTISQPTTVVIMTHALDVKPGQKVMEIGAGSGYQAAILSHLVGRKGRVWSTEIIGELAGLARDNLRKSAITNVSVLRCDGSVGYAKNAPFDRIIVTAACPGIPKQLLEQLSEGGILVAPVGSGPQKMIKMTKKKGRIITESLGCFRFVLLRGKYGYP